MIPPGLVIRLGVSQLICWGISYYLVGVFGERITADLGWSPAVTYGGFSLALIVMGIASPLVGRVIDRRGGRPVMVAGSWLTALGCAVLALSRGPLVYFAAWACLGLAMRMTLYDAAFAALARIGGARARRPISQVTLLGGLASTAFWPIGHALADALGWRWALLVYAGFALLTLPLHLGIPSVARAGDGTVARAGAGAEARPEAAAHADAAPLAVTRGDRLLAGALYALIATITTFLNSAMSAHMIGILAGLGVGASLAVWISTLRGIGQSSARLCEVLFGAAMSPLQLGVLATGALPLCFVAGQYSGASPAAAIAFALLYGASNGLVTIVRGTLPLALFEPSSYGRIVGGLLLPSFFFSALAPLAYALVIERFGVAASLHLSTALAAVVLAAAVASLVQFGGRRARRRTRLAAR